ncbi:MAG: hypothetical protein ABIB47_03620 [Candidatus Woesearchaeota archaeon]
MMRKLNPKFNLRYSFSKKTKAINIKISPVIIIEIRISEFMISLCNLWKVVLMFLRKS